MLSVVNNVQADAEARRGPDEICREGGSARTTFAAARRPKSTPISVPEDDFGLSVARPD